MTKAFLRAGLCLLPIVLCARPANAVTVLLGQTATLPGTTAAQRPELDGTTVASDTYTLIGSSTVGAYDAKILFNVIQENSGSLDFTYQIVGSDNTTPLKWKLVVANLLFPALDTDVRLDSPGIDAPITVSVDPTGIATYSSATPLQPGEESHVIFIHAEGITQFKQGGLIELVTDFGSEPNPPGLGSPNGTFVATGFGAAPEPRSLALLAIAMASLCLRFRRSRAPLPFADE